MIRLPLHSRPAFAIALCVAFLVGTAAGQSITSPPTIPPPPWPTVLGARMHVCQMNRPVVSRVVLVPDVDTWLEEVGRWSTTAQWPVLLEFDPHAASFIRGFQPTQILRVPATERRLPADPDQRRIRMLQVVRRSWGADPDQPVVEAYPTFGWEPPGFTVTSPLDPAWPAAVAISAARGVPLVFLDEDLGRPNAIMDAEMLATIESRLRSAAASITRSFDRAATARLASIPPNDRPARIPATWESTGDLIEAVAICRAMPGRVRFVPPAGGRVRDPRADAGAPPSDGPFATTDALCRLDDGERWGYVGWIWGDEARAINMAMSSIFLERRNLWFISGYQDAPPWNQFAVKEVSVQMTELGYASLYLEGEDADLEDWRKMLRGGIRPDILYLNSHGNPAEFHLHDDERARTSDVPFLHHPMALSLVHSFALQRPDDPGTVGGRFLDRGVYAFVGSVDEPYLSAFLPPAFQARRLAAGVPFLLAGRLWPGEAPMSGVWKVTTIGDPFMIALRPKFREVPEVPIAEAPPVPDAVPLQDVARAALAAVREDPSRAGEAIRLLELLGQDALAIETWNVVLGSGDLAAITGNARVVLGPLFRESRWQAFLDAYERLPAEGRDDDARDMLWHLMTPRLQGVRDPDTIALLERETRAPFDIEDLGILLPHIDRVLGDGRGQAAVMRRIDTEQDSGRRGRWRRLLDVPAAF